MTNLSKAARARLAETYVLGISTPVESVESRDGTIKYLFRTAKGHYIESVFIPDGERATLCVSSQVGCKNGVRVLHDRPTGLHGATHRGRYIESGLFAART